MKGKEQKVFDKALEADLKKSASESAKEMEDNGMLQNLDNPLAVDGDDIPKEGYKLNRSEQMLLHRSHQLYKETSKYYPDQRQILLQLI